MRLCLSIFLLAVALVAPAAAQMDYQPPPDLEPLNQAYDKFLDAYARDGIFSFREIRPQRAIIDRYVTSLNSPGPAPERPSARKNCPFASYSLMR